MKKKTILTLAFASLLSGCVTRPFKVDLRLPDSVPQNSAVKVVDNRGDNTVYMTAITVGGTSSIGIFEPEPPIETVLAQYIINTDKGVLVGKKVNIAIENLDLKNRVGFGTNDDQTCKIESRIETNSQPITQAVRTFVRNTENRSSFIYNAAKVILHDCLKTHALDIGRILADK
jgi:hypothetical protein